MDKEAFYDAEIAPALAELAQRCESNGMTMVCAVEYAPGEWGSTTTLREDATYALKAAAVAIHTNGNVDALIYSLIKHAEEHGHSSIYLKQLGVPLNPQEPTED